MLHPSYSDLMDAVNSNVEDGEEPVVQSRYSIVMAASKRARQLVFDDNYHLQKAINQLIPYFLPHQPDY